MIRSWKVSSIGVAASVLLLAVGFSPSPAHGFLDTGGYFSQPRIGTDGTVYVSTKGYGATNSKGAVWAFHPSCEPENTCNALKWVFKPGHIGAPTEAEIFSIPRPYTVDCPSGPDRQIVYVGTQKKVVYALLDHADCRTPTDDSCLGCFRLKKGCVWASEELSGAVMAGPAVDSAGDAYVGTMVTHDFYAFELPELSAAALCSYSIPSDDGSVRSLQTKWEVRPNRAYLRFTPVVDEVDNRDQVFVGAKNGGIYAYDIHEGDRIWSWSYDVNGGTGPGASESQGYHVGGALSVDGDFLYAANADQLVKFDLNALPGINDPPVWRYRLGNQMLTRTAPVVFDENGCENIYITRRDPGTLFKIPSSKCGVPLPAPTPGPGQSCAHEARFRVDGTISWVTPAVVGRPSTWPTPFPTAWGTVSAIAQHMAFTGSHKDDCLYAVAPVLIGGEWVLKKLWDFESPISNEEFFASPAVSGDGSRVFIGDLGGRFWALKTALAGGPYCTGAGGTTCDESQNFERVAWSYNTADLMSPTFSGSASLPYERNTCCPEPGGGNSCDDPGPGECVYPTPTP